MTKDRLQTPCQKKKDRREKIYNYQQWSERFKQNTKRKYITDIGPLMTEETIT